MPAVQLPVHSAALLQDRGREAGRELRDVAYGHHPTLGRARGIGARRLGAGRRVQLRQGPPGQAAPVSTAARPPGSADPGAQPPREGGSDIGGTSGRHRDCGRRRSSSGGLRSGPAARLRGARPGGQRGGAALGELDHDQPNGHTTSGRVTVIAFVAVDGGVPPGGQLQRRGHRDRAARGARPGRGGGGPAAPARRGRRGAAAGGPADPGWDEPGVETSIGVFGRWPAGWPRCWPDRSAVRVRHPRPSRRPGGHSTGVRRRWCSRPGRIELNAKTPTCPGRPGPGRRPPTSPTSTSSRCGERAERLKLGKRKVSRNRALRDGAAAVRVAT